MLAPGFASASRQLWRCGFSKSSELQNSADTLSLGPVSRPLLQSFRTITRMLSRGFAWPATNPGCLSQAPPHEFCSSHALATSGAANVHQHICSTRSNFREHPFIGSNNCPFKHVHFQRDRKCFASLLQSQVQSTTPSFSTNGSTLKSLVPFAWSPSLTYNLPKSIFFSSKATPLLASFTRPYATGHAALDTPEPSVSVRSPHGAGTEGLSLTSQGLKRVDTDQAANESSTDPSAVKDVLGGRKQQAFTPSAPPPTDGEIQALHDFIVDSENLLIVTGAGVSTESGIPDYRSPTGAYSTGFKPMTHQEFVRSAASRQRYWARSYFGWRRFLGTLPNETHRALATLEGRGRVRGGMITQNVDRLHHASGSSPLELHGTTHQVVCMNCQALSDRQEFQEKLAALNPQWIDSIEAAERGDDVLAGTPGLQRPDGDVEIGEAFLRKGLFKVPVCENCGADALKPDVVFFGDNVPKWRVDRAMAMVKESHAMLVVGSSLMVLSAYRLARAAADASTPIAILNVGPTRADDLATLRVGARSGEVLPRLLNCGSLTIPT